MKNIITAMAIGLSATLGLGILFTCIGGLFYVVGSVAEKLLGPNFGIVGSLAFFTFLAMSVAAYMEMKKHEKK